MKKKGIAALLALMCILICCMPVSGHADMSGGGWYLEGDVLYITRNLGDYIIASSSSPYYTSSVFESAGILSEVRSVVVSEGVTIIGGLTFFRMINMTSISLPSTLREIHGEAFMHCSSLSSITIPANVDMIGPYAFTQSGIRTVEFKGDAPKTIGYGISYWYDFYTTEPPFSSNRVDAYYDSDKNWTPAKMSAMGYSIVWHDINVIDSGSCGDYATWSYNNKHHVLTVTGTGALYDYASGSDTPWSAYNSEITSVVVKDGISAIPGSAFASVTHLHTAQLPSTLSSLSCGAFSGCPELSSLTLPASLTGFDQGQPFSGCASLTDIYYLGTEDEWQQVLNHQDCVSDSSSLSVHCLVLHEAAASTCIEEGHDAYYAFDGSGNTDVYSLNKAPLSGIPYLPLSGHELIKHDRVEVSGTEDGTEEYWRCSVCGRMFSDAAGSNEIPEPVVIPAVTSGTCGDGLEWAVENGTLTISGTGPMDNFNWSESAGGWQNIIPWYSCRGLIHTVVLTDGVTRIGNNAFYNCAVMTSASIPGSVTAIGEGAFEECDALGSVTIPDSVTSVGEEAFDCYDEADHTYRWIKCLANVGSEGARALSRAGYYFCAPEAPDIFLKYGFSSGDVTGLNVVKAEKSIVSADIPQTVTAIGNYAFQDCTDLAAVTIPDSVTVIGTQAFQNCGALGSVTFPAGITSIGGYAFDGCGLTEVSLPTAAVTCGKSAFDSTVIVTAPAAAGEYGEYAYEENEWVYTVQDSSCTVIGWNGTKTDLTVPEDLNGFHVTAFGSAVFKGKTFLRSVVLPDDVTQIGTELFSGCTSLVSADLGECLTDLPQQTFYGCRALTEADLPQTLTGIGRYAFANCTTITSVDLPAGVREIGSSAFYNCSNMVTAPIPASLTVLSSSAFRNCNSLLAVSLPDSLTTLGSGVFAGCSALTNVTIGSGLQTIESDVFAGLPSLKTVTVNGNGTYICDEAFAGCTALQTVSIGNAVVGTNAFMNCTGLKTFSMDGGYFEGSAFSGCAMLQSVTLGSGVISLPSGIFSDLKTLENVQISGLTEIPDRAFSGCTGLTGLTLTDGLTVIGDYAFSGCTGLTVLDLPSTVTEIRSHAFSGCTGLTPIDFPSAVTLIGAYAFSGCSNLSAVALPGSLVTVGESAFAGCPLDQVVLPAGVRTVGRNAFPATTRVYCDPSSPAAISISRNGGSFVSPDNDEFGIRWLLDEDILLGLSVEQIWTDSDTIVIPEYIGSETVTEIGMSALASCPTVVNVTFPASVPVIPEGLCRGNDRLVSVVIPEGVTSIGAEAFADCTHLSYVSLPQSLTVIGARAFDGCTLLAQITLSDKLQEIGEDAFTCTTVYANLDTDTARMLSRSGAGFVCPEYPLLHLKYLFVGGQAVSLEVIGAEETAVTLTVPEGVTSIAAHAFENRARITSISLPDSLTAVGEYAFAGCGVTGITLPAGVTEIPAYAFYQAASIRDFETLGVITAIGESAFEESGVTQVSFREGLTEVGDAAFRNAAALTAAQLPDSVSSMGYYCFDGCTSLTAFTVPTGMTAIPAYAFRGTAVMESLTVPNGLVTIEYCAFQNSGLASVSLPSTVKTIDNDAFENCRSLVSVTLTGDMDYIGQYAFSNCDHLTSLTMPDTLSEMGAYAFHNAKALQDVTLPDGLNTIPEWAFYGCSALTHVKVGDGTVAIGSNAFSSCDALKSVELPNTLVRINNHAFSSTSLTAVTLPETVTIIGDYAFNNCRSLTDVTLPAGLVHLGECAFRYCSALVSLTLSPNMTSVPPYAFYQNTSLTAVSIPEGIRSIGEGAFAQDYHLSAVLIPRSVTSIDPTAFQYIDHQNLTVYCYHDTAASAFAENGGYPVIYLDGDDLLSGLSIVASGPEGGIYLGVGASLDDIDTLFALSPENVPQTFAIDYAAADTSVASVTGTTLTGVAPGDTVLTASLTDNPAISAEIPVHVRDNINGFTIRLSGDIWLHRDDTLTLEPDLIDPAGAVTGFTWSIDRALGTIDGNVLTPTAFGSGILSAVSWDGKTDQVTIHIYEDPAWVKIVDVPVGMGIGDTAALTAQVKAGDIFTDDLALHFVTWSSSDDSVASVAADGTVTGHAYGTAVITAMTDNGVSGTAQIYVTPEIEYFKLPGRVTIPVGTTMDLHAVDIVPANANPNAFSWRVEPEGLVSYADGKVTVLTDQDCEVRIIATPWRGCGPQYTDLTIYRPVVEQVTIEDVNPWNWVPEYSDIQLTAKVLAVEEFENQLVTWSVDSSSCTITQDGVLHTGYNSYVTVTATADNGVSGSIRLQVMPPTTDFTLPERIPVQTGETVTVSPVNDTWAAAYTMSVGTPSLASVDGMTITGLGPGTTELTVTSWNGVARTASVLVYDPIETVTVSRIESLNGRYSVSAPETDLFFQMNYRAHAVASSDKDYVDDLITWTSSDPAVIQVTDPVTGAFRTIKYGTATLTATAKDGVSGSIVLNVRREVETFALADLTAYILADQALSVESIQPADAYDGFVWDIPASVGTVDGQILHVTTDTPQTVSVSATSWDGYVTRTAELTILDAPVTAVSLEPYGNNELGVGGAYQLTAHVTAGTGYVNRFITWTSDDPDVAAVDADGVVRALRAGTVTITAAAENDPAIADSLIFSCVQGVDAFTVTPEEIRLYTGDSAVVSISDILPADAAVREFTYTAAPEGIARVEDGVFHALSEQNAEGTLTVRSWNGTERVIPVTVTRPTLDALTLDEVGDVSVGTQVAFTARATVAGEEFVNRFVTFASSDENVLSIDPVTGAAAANSEGTATVTAFNKFDGVRSASVTVTVRQALESFDFYCNSSSISLPANSYTLNCYNQSITPSRAYIDFTYTADWTGGDVTITSSDNNYVYLTCTGDGEGDIVVTAANVNGVSRSVTIPARYYALNYLSPADPAPLYCLVDGSAAVTVSPWIDKGQWNETRIDPAKLILTYSSADESIATVDAAGTVTGVAKGETVITVTHPASGTTADVPVRVVRPVTSFDLPSRVLVPNGVDVDLEALNVKPDGADASDLVWTVSPADIARIDGNVIRSLVTSDVTGTLTAASPDGVTRTAELVLYNPWVESVELEPMPYVPTHRNIQFIAHVRTVDGEEYINQYVTFKVYWDEGLTSEYQYQIDPNTGTMSYSSSITLYINATAASGASDTIKVRFMPVYESFEITPVVALHPNENADIRVTSYAPSSQSNPDHDSARLLYEAEGAAPNGDRGYSNDLANSWNGYDISPTGQTGTYTVKVSSPVSGIERMCQVVIYNDEDIEGITLTGDTGNVTVYQNIPLKAMLSIYGETVEGNSLVTWTSDAPQVVSVTAAGVARTLKSGTAAVTATTPNGLTASIVIEVNREPDNWTLPAAVDVQAGEPFTLTWASVTPANARMDVTWSVEPADAAVISGNVLTASADCTVPVTLTAVNWDGTVRTAPLMIWGGADYAWSDDFSTMTATHACLNNGGLTETETVTAQAGSTATCDQPGVMVFTAVFENTAFTAQSVTTDIEAAPLGHDWGESVYTWSDDRTTVTASHVCLRDGSHSEEETVSVSERYTTAPTCSAEGTCDLVTDAFENPAFEVQTMTDVTAPALGHDWGETEYVWADDYSTVTARRVCLRDGTHKEEETVSAYGQVIREATCEEPGVTLYTSYSFGNEAFTVQEKNVEDAEPLGHDWGETEYIWADDFSAVTARRVCLRDGGHEETETVPASLRTDTELDCDNAGTGTYVSEAFENSAFTAQELPGIVIPALGHEPAADEAVAPTCTGTGLTEGSHCSRCGKTLTAQETVDALGHEPVEDAAVPPTCTMTGLTAGTHCSRCGEVLTAQETVDALGHEPVTDPARDPACTAAGLTEGSHCGRCGETLTAQEVIPALGHEYVRDAEKAPTCEETGLTAGFHCGRCDTVFVQQQVVPALGHDPVTDAGIEPTCLKPGLSSGLHCGRCDKVIVAQTVIDALGHDPVTDPAVQATCTADGLTEGSHCGRCGLTLVQQNIIDALGHDKVTDAAKLPTCTEDGLTEGSHCGRCGETLVPQETVPALGHVVLIDEAAAETCTADGRTEGSHCGRCGEILVAQETIPAPGHNVITDEGTEATCTEDGLTEGSHCGRCGEILVAQETIPALGHNVIPDEGSEATCTADGKTEGSHCGRCGETLVPQAVIPALGHHEVTDAAAAPTCTQPGLAEGSHCDRCGEVFTAQTAVAALGHDEVTDDGTEATCTQKGLTEGSHCRRCGEILTAQEVIPALGHQYVKENEKAATCTQDGLTAGFYCGRCGERFVEQEVVPALGHDEAVMPRVEPTCGSTGLTEGLRCKRCGITLVPQEVIPALDHHTPVTVPAVAPTCTGTGLTEGEKCSVCGEILTAQETVPATGHTIETIPGREATCTQNGVTEGEECSVCGTITLTPAVIPAKGHTEVTVPGKAATCTGTGLTDGKKCTVCGVTTVAQQTIPAKGHTVVIDKAVAATYTSTGLTEGKHCSVCGTVLAAQQVIPKLTPTATPGPTATPEPAVAAVDANTFPDAAFRNWVSANADKNGDGKLTSGEIAAVKAIDLSAVKTVEKLDGIAVFKSLETLDVSNNKLTELDVSKLTELKTLKCSNNRLTSLDLSKNTKLTAFTCTGNVYTVKVKAGIFDLSTLKGFDISKASGFSGGTVSGTALTALQPGDVTYTYDCGMNQKAVFTLKLTADEVAVDKVTPKKTSYAYTGKAIEPTLVVTAMADGREIVLKAGQYEAEYKDNVKAGTATVTVTGKGFFTGTVTAEFEITPVKLASAKLKYTTTVYTGKALKPTATVKAKVGGKTVTLKSGTDYTLTYEDNVKPGKAVVTVKGKGNFTGTLTKTFTITGAPITEARVKNASLPYNGKEKTPILIVKAKVGTKTVSLVKNRDYTATYTNNKNAGTATVTVKGIGNYSGTMTATFKINPLKMKTATVTLDKTTMTYTGKALKPKVTVTMIVGTQTVILTKGTDYTVTYSDNKQVGTATVTVTGKGNFTGTVQLNFTIEPKTK